MDESGPGKPPTPGERAAVAVCAVCPLLAYGVAGGLNDAQRREQHAARLDRGTAAA